MATNPKLVKGCENTTFDEINHAKQTIYNVRDGFNNDDAKSHFAAYLEEHGIEDTLNSATKQAMPLNGTSDREQRDIKNDVLDTKNKALRFASAAQIVGQDQNDYIDNIDIQTTWLNQTAHMIVNLPRLKDHVSEETMRQYIQQARGKIDLEFHTYREKAETELKTLDESLRKEIYDNQMPEYNKSSDLLQYYIERVNQTLQNHPEYISRYNNHIDRIRQLHTLLGFSVTDDIRFKSVTKSSDNTSKSTVITNTSQTQPSFKKVHVPDLPTQESSGNVTSYRTRRSGSVFKSLFYNK